jgi:C-terminal processing protease CtpA/Prc
LGFFTENEIQFYFLKTAFPSSKTIKCWHIGAFFKKKNGNFLVSSLLEKYPASMSGLKKEDKILLANGKVFHPVNSFKKKKSVVLTIERSGVKINIKVKTVHESLHDSFVSATAKSIRIYKMANKQKIGYIHIWALGFRKMFRKVRQIIAKRLKKTDAIIVDLRGGFGGSWIKYIDILCSVKKNNFPGKLDRLGRYTKTKMHPFLFRRKTKAITTPIAVIVDRTTRSGKEFLAHYVQKNKCASVFGEKTAGAFTGARLPIEEDKYILMIPFSEATFGRSKKKLEGIGFTPKNKMSFHPKEELSSVKLKRIFNLLQKKTRAHQKHKRGL